VTMVGYARVSGQGQNLDQQVQSLRAEGAGRVYSEKVSASGVVKRPELTKLMSKLQPGDVVVVTKLDRLARSTRDLLNLLDEIAAKGASFRSMDGAVNTSGPAGKLLTTMLAAIAEFERSLIQERCDAGIKRARAAGVKFGRRRKLSVHQQNEARARREAGESQSLLAASYGVSQPTISRL
jgi:DNA invertase Pin-like site-specific DNA recombinase